LLFDLSERVPHGFCLTWDPQLLWLHAGSDAMALLAYLSIPSSLIWLLRRRRDRTYRWIAYLFVLFIVRQHTAWISSCSGCRCMDAGRGQGGNRGSIGHHGDDTLDNGATARRHAVAHLADRSDAELRKPSVSKNGRWASCATPGSSFSDPSFLWKMTVPVGPRRLPRPRPGCAGAAERVTTNEILAKSVAECQASFVSATIGKVPIEPLSGQLIRVNAAFAGMLGYKVESLVDRPIWDLAYPDDRAAARTQFDQLLAGEINHWIMESGWCAVTACRSGSAFPHRSSSTAQSGSRGLQSPMSRTWTCATTSRHRRSY
jgi:PAS domain-containing protein